MKLSALLTSAGINIGLCVLMVSLYSLLRKQPGNLSVYFGRRIGEEGKRLDDGYFLERLVPSASWILKAWETSEEDMLNIAGLDAVVFLRLLIFSIRIFSIAAVICVFGVLPLNYFGKQMNHTNIPSQSLEVFTIGNVQEGSRWLWVHCLALYIITISACTLLYFEYKSIARMRLVYITQSPPNPSHFSVLVRAIPKSIEESFSDSVRNFFTNYHASSYLSHQMVYKVGKVQELVKSAGKVYKKVLHLKSIALEKKHGPFGYRCGLCGGMSNSFQLYRDDFDLSMKKTHSGQSGLCRKEKECAAAFVSFKTRYAAVVASRVLQSSNPMSWVTDLAPEPHDVYWSNIWIPYKQLWFRRIATLLASIAFMILFLAPVTFVQGLTQLDKLQQTFPFLKSILKKPFISQLVTGYLPSVILMLFLYTVPPLMMLLSVVEGPISRSGRKRSACFKILCFNIWNVFFVNIFSGTFLTQLNVLSRPKELPSLLARALPTQATFFITYVLTSGWTSLSSELMQLFFLIWNFIRRHIFQIKRNPDYVPSFPYYIEVPRVLFFGLLGFTCSVQAPLILPFLLVYFFLGYIVYRNQVIILLFLLDKDMVMDVDTAAIEMLNVYRSRYETGGQMWPIMHNTTVFSLVLAQVIAIGVFGTKKSPVSSGFSILLAVCTVLFSEYCRHRFYPVFKCFSAQDLIDMDREDEQNGRMEEIHEYLLSAYSQFPPDPPEGGECEAGDEGGSSGRLDGKDSPEDLKDGLATPPTHVVLPIDKFQQADKSLALATIVTSKDKDTSL